MTVQEVIKAIRLDGLSINGRCHRIQQFTEGIAEATELLEKQIPKKAIYKKGQYGEFFECPICKSLVLAQEYCSECGQKLDWEEGGTSD